MEGWVVEVKKYVRLLRIMLALSPLLPFWGGVMTVHASEILFSDEQMVYIRNHPEIYMGNTWKWILTGYGGLAFLAGLFFILFIRQIWVTKRLEKRLESVADPGKTGTGDAKGESTGPGSIGPIGDEVGEIGLVTVDDVIRKDAVTNVNLAAATFAKTTKDEKPAAGVRPGADAKEDVKAGDGTAANAKEDVKAKDSAGVKTTKDSVDTKTDTDTKGDIKARPGADAKTTKDTKRPSRKTVHVNRIEAAYAEADRDYKGYEDETY